MKQFRISGASTNIKLLITFFLLCMALAYVVALINVYDKTQFTYNGTAVHYVGDEDEMIFPKEFPEMVEISHPHLLGMSMMFLLLCSIFVFSSASALLKRIIVIFSFGSIILDLGSAWLIRYVASQFAILMILAGVIMAICFLVMFLIPLKDMWLIKKET
ncbi:MAG: hypothetical protein HQ534_10555 [Armatimonadetes bacterium]|nr:hypothetical protein [Armatimonadota bacterium]